MRETKEQAARRPLFDDLDEAIADIADARKLMPHVELDQETAAHVTRRLGIAQVALSYARAAITRKDA